MTRRLGAILVVFVAVLVSGCNVASTPAVGSGRVVAQQREVGSFTRIRVGDAIQATVIVGPDVTVQVTADDNIQGDVTTNVTLGTLNVGMQGTDQPTAPVKVAITVPNLEALEATSAATVIATGINNPTFDAEADAAAELTARGNSDTVEVTVTDAATADLGGIPAQTASVKVGSAASATVNAQVSVGGSVDTGGVIHIEGNPASVTVSSASGGTVIHD